MLSVKVVAICPGGDELMSLWKIGNKSVFKQMMALFTDVHMHAWPLQFTSLEVLIGENEL